MRRFVKSTLLTLAVAFIATACVHTPEHQPEEPATLQLSKNIIEIESLGIPTAEVASVTIETNQANVKAQSLAPEWVEATIRGNGIYIKATENRSGNRRKTSILVFAGDKVEVIEVIQKSATIYMKISPTKVEVPSEGKTYLVNVESNGDWTFEVDEEADWLAVDRIDNFLQVKVDPNTTTSIRESSVYVTMAGAKPKEIKVTQKPYNNGMRYSLPLLQREITIHNILKYEREQGSYLVNYKDENFGTKILFPTAEFVYSSPLFTLVTYTIASQTNTLDRVVMLSRDPDTLLSDEFIQALRDASFEVSLPNNATSYKGSSKELGFDVEVVTSKLNESTITFKPTALT